MKYSLRRENNLWFLINRTTGLISTAKDFNLGCMLFNRFNKGLGKTSITEGNSNIPPGYDSEGKFIGNN